MTPRSEVITCDLGYAFLLVDYQTGVVSVRPQHLSMAQDGVVIHVPPSAPSWGTQEVPFGAQPSVRQPMAASSRAVVALGLVSTTRIFGRRHLAFSRLFRLLRITAHRSTHRAALPEEIMEVVEAVRRVAIFFPCRVACLEMSVSAFLLLTSRGLAVRWCHGVATDPITLHAWLETLDGRRPAEPRSTDRFATIRTIPEDSEETP